MWLYTALEDPWAHYMIFGSVLGRPLDTFFWALTLSWSRLLARVKWPVTKHCRTSETSAEEDHVPLFVSETCSSSSRTLIRIAWNTRASRASPLSGM